MNNDRRDRLRKRGQEAAQDRGQRNLGGSGLKVPLDLSKASARVVWYELSADPRKLNLIDIVPFEVSTPIYSQLRQFTGKPVGLTVGDMDYKLEICSHQKIGVSSFPVLCLREMFGGKCQICDDMFAEYRKKGTPEFNEKLAKSLSPQWRVIYKVFDYNDDSHTDFKLWDIAYKSFEEYLCEKAASSDDGYVAFSDPIDGKKMEIEGRVKKIGTFDYIEPVHLRFLPRSGEPYSDDDIKAFPLDKMLIVPTYDEVTQLYYCSAAGDDQPSQPPTRELHRPTDPPSALDRGRRREMDSPRTELRNLCVGGGAIGKDLHKFPECQDTCAQEVFDRCQNEYDRLQQPKSTPQRILQDQGQSQHPADNTPADAPLTRRRR